MEKVIYYVKPIVLDSGHTVDAIYCIYLDRVVKSLKEDINTSDLFPTTKKKVISIIDSHFKRKEIINSLQTYRDWICSNCGMNCFDREAYLMHVTSCRP